MGIPDACVVEMSRVPEDLLCSICSELCSEPIQTTCSHVFCRICISNSILTSNNCPICRSRVERTSPISDINPILDRIWQKIKVRCPFAIKNSCEWNGSTADFSAHKIVCQRRSPSLLAERAMQDLQRECLGLRAQVQDLNKKLEEVQRERESEQRLANRHIRSLSSELDLARSSSAQIEFDFSYRYDRFRVVELSKYIACNLESKPPFVDVNRLYNCVKHIRDDLERCRHDNPDHLDLDVRMLLATCAASNWFTSRQHQNITEWMSSGFFDD